MSPWNQPFNVTGFIGDAKLNWGDDEGHNDVKGMDTLSVPLWMIFEHLVALIDASKTFSLWAAGFLRFGANKR